MAGTGISRPSKWKVGFAALVVLALAVGAAGSATAARREAQGPRSRCDREARSRSASRSSTTTRSPTSSTSQRGDQQKTAQVFVDYINKNGGVDGRKIVPFFKKYEPIPGRTPDPLALCTSWTEDDGVFAVLGVFIDFTGQGQLCLTKEHNTIHIGHELEQPWIDESPPGLAPHVGHHEGERGQGLDQPARSRAASSRARRSGSSPTRTARAASRTWSSRP